MIWLHEYMIIWTIRPTHLPFPLIEYTTMCSNIFDNAFGPLWANRLVAVAYQLFCSPLASVRFAVERTVFADAPNWRSDTAPTQPLANTDRSNRVRSGVWVRFGSFSICLESDDSGFVKPRREQTYHLNHRLSWVVFILFGKCKFMCIYIYIYIVYV